MFGNTVHTLSNGFCTVCGETEEWIRSSGAKFTEVQAAGRTFTEDGAEKVMAADLAKGDVIRYDERNVWKIVEVLKETAAMITYSFEYVRTQDSDRVGLVRSKTSRKSTKFLLV